MPAPTLRQVSPGAVAERLNGDANTVVRLGAVLQAAAAAKQSLAERLAAATAGGGGSLERGGGGGLAGGSAGANGLEAGEVEGSSTWHLMRVLRSTVQAEAQTGAVTAAALLEAAAMHGCMESGAAAAVTATMAAAASAASAMPAASGRGGRAGAGDGGGAGSFNARFAAAGGGGGGSGGGDGGAAGGSGSREQWHPLLVSVWNEQCYAALTEADAQVRDARTP
jgi:hypothetical protein